MHRHIFWPTLVFSKPLNLSLGDYFLIYFTILCALQAAVDVPAQYCDKKFSKAEKSSSSGIWRTLIQFNPNSHLK